METTAIRKKKTQFLQISIWVADIVIFGKKPVLLLPLVSSLCAKLTHCCLRLYVYTDKSYQSSNRILTKLTFVNMTPLPTAG